MDNCSEKHNVDEMKSPDKKSLGRKEPKIATEGECFCCPVCLGEVKNRKATNDNDQYSAKEIVVVGSIGIVLAYPRGH